MSGTLFGLGLSQRVDPNGKPEAGWRLYLYQAASSVPVTAYKDTALTAGLEHPWPIQADAYGMMPSFWLADGSYRARGISSDGSRVFFDLPSVLALGASSGSGGGGGGTVDATAIFQTGDTIWLPLSGTRSGWVRENGRTIGSATSGATERANSDCQSLFTFLWNNYADTFCAVSGGRGASASADWTANKQIALLDMRNCVPGGVADMGNSATTIFNGVPLIKGNVTTPGSVVGETLHTLTVSELATHTHNPAVNDPGHVHSFTRGFSGGQASASGGNPNAGALITADTEVSTTGISIGIANEGGGNSHNNTQRTILGTFYRKL